MRACSAPVATSSASCCARSASFVDADAHAAAKLDRLGA